jgi:hypothetical protein
LHSDRLVNLCQGKSPEHNSIHLLSQAFNGLNFMTESALVMKGPTTVLGASNHSK